MVTMLNPLQTGFFTNLHPIPDASFPMPALSYGWAGKHQAKGI
jgi:hypothetical protein